MFTELREQIPKQGAREATDQGGDYMYAAIETPDTTSRPGYQELELTRRWFHTKRDFLLRCSINIQFCTDRNLLNAVTCISNDIQGYLYSRIINIENIFGSV